jgi:HEAT repeat protein
MSFAYPVAAAQTQEALKQRMRSMPDYFHNLLKDGGLARVLEVIAAQPQTLADLLPIVANPDASINVRIGASAIFERYANSAVLRTMVPALGMLSMHGDHRVRADACYTLGLSGAPQAARFLEPRLADPDAEVREIAAEGLDALETTEGEAAHART